MATGRATADGQLTFSEADQPTHAPAAAAKRARTAPQAVSASTALPELLDRKRFAAETGLPRSAIDVIFRHCPVVALPGHRKVYVRRADVSAYLDQHTFRDDRIRPNAEAA